MEKVWRKIEFNHNVVQIADKKWPNMEKNMEKKKTPFNHEVFSIVNSYRCLWVGVLRPSASLSSDTLCCICVPYRDF